MGNHPGDFLDHCSANFRERCGSCDVAKGNVLNFLRGISEQTLDGGTYKGESPFFDEVIDDGFGIVFLGGMGRHEIDGPDDVGDVVGDDAIAFFAGAEHFHCPFLLGDIVKESEETRGVFVMKVSASEIDIDDGAVFSETGNASSDLQTPLFHRGEQIEDMGEVFLGMDVGERQAEQFIVGVA